MKIRKKDVIFLIIIAVFSVLFLLKINDLVTVKNLFANINIENIKYPVLRTYEVGNNVFFDPVNYEICDENSDSETCYNWVAIKKNNNNYELYLKGIYESMLWTEKNPVDVIKNYTQNWDDRLTIDSSYDIEVTEDYGYKFSEAKARILTKSEYDKIVDKSLLVKPYTQSERYKYLIIDTQNRYFDNFGYNGQYATDVGTYFDFDTNSNQGAYANDTYLRPVISINMENVGNSISYEYLAEFVSGNVIWESQRLSENKKISKPLNPTKEGYKFVKWVTENGDEYNFDNLVTKSIRLYAEYEAIPENTLRTINKYDTVDFDPVNYRFCDEDYDSDTCYSWIVINKNGNEYDLYSRTVTQDMSWNETNIVNIIKNYTTNWDDRLTVDSSYDISYSEGSANLNFKFSETKARLLTYDEYNVGEYREKVALRNLFAAVMNPEHRYINYSKVDTKYIDTTHSSQNFDLVYSYSFSNILNYESFEPKVYAVPVIHINLEEVGNNKEKDMPNYTCRRATKNITLGQMNTKGTLKSGDVFDCNVDGTGYTERFYYVTDLEENTDYGVLLYSHNVRNGKIYDFIGYKDQDVGQDRSNFQYDRLNRPAVNGPATARVQLPAKQQWTNIRLYNEKRNIYDPVGVLRVEGFSYEYWSARLLTYKEALNACGIEYTPRYESHSIEINPGCSYLADGLVMHGGDIDTDEFMSRGLPYMTKSNNLPWQNWLETPLVYMYMNGDSPVFDSNYQGAVTLYSQQGTANIYSYTSDVTDESDKGIKPAIEVRKELLNYGATIKVTYNDEGRIEEKLIPHGGKASAISSKGKEYYTFKHWSLNVNGNEFDFDTVLEDDTTLYAVYELDTYTISYDLDGGTVSTANPTSYTPLSENIILNNPTKEHYTFIGWSGTGLTGNDNTSVIIQKGSTGNKSFVANYEIDKYNVEFYDGEELKTTQVINHGSKMNQDELPTLSKEGYRFAGWTEKNSEEIFDLEKAITKSYKLYSKYEIINYNISYDLDEGSLEENETNPATYTIETNTFTLNNPTKEHYTFIGWTGSNGETPNKVVTIAKGSMGDKSYTANYEINKYNVEFYNDTKLLGLQVITHGEKIVSDDIPKTEKTGYKFIGWREKESTKNFDFDTVITKSYKLYATFEKIDCTLKITSNMYSVDEEKKEINNVPENEEIEVIKKNLIIDGTLKEITNEYVTITCDDKTKTYKINRIWIPKTGNVLTRGMIIFGYLGIILILLFVIRKQVDINKRLRERL